LSALERTDCLLNVYGSSRTARPTPTSRTALSTTFHCPKLAVVFNREEEVRLPLQPIPVDEQGVRKLAVSRYRLG